eukprot:1331360-Rhodomonas_salina.8
MGYSGSLFDPSIRCCTTVTDAGCTVLQDLTEQHVWPAKRDSTSLLLALLTAGTVSSGSMSTSLLRRRACSARMPLRRQTPVPRSRIARACL